MTKNFNYLIIINMARTSFNRLIKGADLYSVPIMLTFKQKRYHPTVCGGTLSIISIFLFLIWLGTSLFKVFDLTYTTRVVETLTNEIGVTNPVIWNLSEQNLLVGNRILNLNPSVMTNTDLSTYLS